MIWEKCLNKKLQSNLFKVAKVIANRNISLQDLDYFDYFDFSNKLELSLVSDYDVSIIRAIFDRKSLVSNFHDKKLHEDLSMFNGHKISANFHDKCEIVRIEMIGSLKYFGMKNNFDSSLRYLYFIRNFQDASSLNGANSDDVLFIYLYLFLSNSLFQSRIILQNFDDVKFFTEEQLISLKEALYDQKKFFEIIVNANALKDEISLKSNECEGVEENCEDENNDEIVKNSETSGSGSQRNFNSEQFIDSSDEIRNIEPYRFYSNLHDKVINANKLSDFSELNYLRKKLDLKIKPLKKVTQKQAHQLTRKLMYRQKSYWNLQQEDGILDCNSFANLIINPGHRLCYKKQIYKNNHTNVVTILIDNSGSMRGKPISTAAIVTDVLVQSLESCGIKVEILGFTTANWNGGQTKKDWQKNGKPKSPGRLNDLMHIIYKSADQSWVKSRKNLGVMLKDGVLKENIDGEALIWAAQRLLKFKNRRKILCVISDGFPVDDATLANNPSNFLDLHLKSTIKWLEEKSPIELLAVGIGVDVTKIYRNSVMISDVEKLGESLFSNLAKTL